MSRFSPFALLMSASLLLSYGSALAAEAGKVVFASGSSRVGAQAAVVGGAVNEGDELSTGADGYIYMKTVDDGFLILRPNSKARVIAYHIDAADPANTRVKLELQNGVARSISGSAVKRARHNFRFNTPVAAIGVRGTDFIVHTNAESSWVSVVSGGVVVSGFAGACGPEGNGPCEGVTSRELFADRADAMLQVQRGQSAPRLLNQHSVAPEVNPPARSDEPVGKDSGAPKAGGAPLTEVNLNPAKNIEVLVPATPAPAPLPKPGDDLSTAPPIVGPGKPEVPVVPAVPKEPEILWGRWQAVASRGADTATLAAINANARVNQVIAGSYVIGRPDNSSFVMPREGTAEFNLADYEATLTPAGGKPVIAQVDNASLNIDFAKQSYSTALTVSNHLGRVDMTSSGDVSSSGVMQNSMLSSGYVVRGLLGGANADEAVYSFKGTNTDGLGAAGITRWSR